MARSIISTWPGPVVQVAAEVPAEGVRCRCTVYMVATLPAMASLHCWGRVKWIRVSTPLAVTIVQRCRMHMLLVLLPALGMVVLDVMGGNRIVCSS